MWEIYFMTWPHYFSFIDTMRQFYICPLNERTCQIVWLMIDITHMQQGRFEAEIILYMYAFYDFLKFSSLLNMQIR